MEDLEVAIARLETNIGDALLLTETILEQLRDLPQLGRELLDEHLETSDTPA